MKEKGRVYPLEGNETREVRKKYRSVRTEGRRKLKSTWSEEITQRRSLRSQPASWSFRTETRRVGRTELRKRWSPYVSRKGQKRGRVKHK